MSSRGGENNVHKCREDVGGGPKTPPPPPNNTHTHMNVPGENTLDNINIRALSMIDTRAGRQQEEEEEKLVAQTFRGEACRENT